MSNTCGDSNWTPHLPAVDSLCLTRAWERYNEYYRVPRGTISLPFAKRSHWTVDSGGHIWWANTGEYAIHKLNFWGDTLLTVENALTQLEVTNADRDSAIQWVEHWMETNHRFVPLDYSRIPRVQPAIENIDIDDEGRLWVRRHSRNPFTVFDVCSPDGRYLRSVDTHWALPDLRHTIIANDAIYGVVVDSLHVLYVVRGRVEAK